MSNTSIFKKTIAYLLNFKLRIITLIIFNLILTIFSTIQPTIFSNIINCIAYNNYSKLTTNIYYLIFCFLFSIVFQIFQSYSSYKLAYTIELDLKNKLFIKTLNLNLIEFENTEIGEIINKFENDIKTFSTLFIRNISIIIDFFTVIIISFILIKINFLLAIITFLSFPISFFVFFYFGKKIQSKEVLYKKNYDQHMSFLQEILFGFKTIKVLNNYTFFFNKFNNLQKKVYTISLEKLKVNITGTTLMQFLNFISYILIILIGINQITLKKLTLGGLVAFNTYSNSFSSSLFKLCNLNITLQESMVSIKRISSLFEFNSNINTSYDIAFNLQSQDIHIKNLKFSYNINSKNIINNLNLTIPKNSLTIIKGESGLGKTTLLNLISGLYAASDGTVLIGNLNLKSLNTDYLRKLVFLGLQEPIIFSTSIKENLLLGNPNANQDLMISLCEKLNLNNYINSLPEKYNTKIGINGTNLSIGQKQRISIIRSLLIDSPIYLFDEITSALDFENETIVMNLLKELSRNKTIVLVSHKENCFSYADKILDLNDLQNN